MEKFINVNPVINITNTQDQNKSDKESKKSGFISEDTTKLLEHYKWHVLILIVVIIAYYDPDLIDHTFRLITSVVSAKEGL
jgi:hypothetical protein